MAVSAIGSLQIGRSTRLNEALWDVGARPITGACVDRMIAELEDAGGKVVETIGDEGMAAFPEAQRACATARAIQEAMAQPTASDGVPLRVKVGSHFGPVLTIGRDRENDPDAEAGERR